MIAVKVVYGSNREKIMAVLRTNFRDFGIQMVRVLSFTVSFSTSASITALQTWRS